MADIRFGTESLSCLVNSAAIPPFSFKTTTTWCTHMTSLFSHVDGLFIMESIPDVVSVVARKVHDEHKTHSQISDELKQQFPGVRGLSSRSVRRFCDVHDIRRSSKLTATDLDRVVASSIAMVKVFVVIILS